MKKIFGDILQYYHDHYPDEFKVLLTAHLQLVPAILGLKETNYRINKVKVSRLLICYNLRYWDNVGPFSTIKFSAKVVEGIESRHADYDVDAMYDECGL